MNKVVSELLDALERHTQAMQANTAAVNSLLSRKVFTGADAAKLVDALGADLEQHLTSLRVLADRLEHLRQSATIDQPRPAA